MQFRMKKLHNQLTQTAKEKSELEEIILKQESRINDISSKVGIIEKMLKEKNKELKENEANCLQLVKIIEDQKKVINNLQNSENLNNLTSKKEKATAAVGIAGASKLINELKRKD
jgi:chromosome segregation ATPase